MAVIALVDAKVTINSVVLSDHAKKVTINYSANALDKTAFGNLTKINLAGLLEWNMEVDLEQDYAGGSVDATLFGLVGAAAFQVEAKPTSAANSATNPAYQGNAILEGYHPIDGSVGDLQVFTARFLSAGTLSRLLV
jgi:hypothetical protein